VAQHQVIRRHCANFRHIFPAQDLYRYFLLAEDYGDEFTVDALSAFNGPQMKMK
jgi:hypothetical protein